MYLRAIHAEPDIPTLLAFIRENPLGILTTALDSPSGSFPLLQSTHVPWQLDVSDPAPPTDAAGPARLGTLRGHLARANPHAKALLESAAADGADGALAQDVMVLFTAPAQHYVTPRWYAATKPASGKVVPTWNYAAVQAYGRARVVRDSDDAFFDAHLRALTASAERTLESEAAPWEVDDAPARYVEQLKRAIIGVEIEITELGGKWKMSQEMGEGDRAGVVAGFEALGSDLGRCMADTVRERGEISNARKRAAAAEAAA